MIEENKREWKIIPGYPSYHISNDGKVWTDFKKRYKKAYRNKRGYEIVVLSKNGKRSTHPAHRLVALAFLGPPPFQGACVLHKNDDKNNNHVDNLMWGTREENFQQAIENGKIKLLKLTLSEDKIYKIKELLDEGETINRISLLCGVTPYTVKKVEGGDL